MAEGNPYHKISKRDFLTSAATPEAQNASANAKDNTSRLQSEALNPVNKRLYDFVDQAVQTSLQNFFQAGTTEFEKLSQQIYTNVLQIVEGKIEDGDLADALIENLTALNGEGGKPIEVTPDDVKVTSTHETVNKEFTRIVPTEERTTRIETQEVKDTTSEDELKKLKTKLKLLFIYLRSKKLDIFKIMSGTSEEFKAIQDKRAEIAADYEEEERRRKNLRKEFNRRMALGSQWYKNAFSELEEDLQRPRETPKKPSIIRRTLNGLFNIQRPSTTSSKTVNPKFVLVVFPAVTGASGTSTSREKSANRFRIFERMKVGVRKIGETLNRSANRVSKRFSDSFNNVKKLIGTKSDWKKPTLTEIKEKQKKPKTPLLKRLKESGSAVFDRVGTSITEKAKAVGHGVKEGVKYAGKKVWEQTKKVGKKIGSAVKKTMERVGKELKKQAARAAKAAYKAGKKVVAKAYKVTTKAITGGMNLLGKGLQSLGKAATAIPYVGVVLGPILTGIGVGLSAASKALKKAFEAIGRVAAQAANAVEKAVKQMRGAAKKLQEGGGKSASGSMFQMITDPFGFTGSLFSKVTSAGIKQESASMVNKMMSGIKSLKEKLKHKADGFNFKPKWGSSSIKKEALNFLSGIYNKTTGLVKGALNSGYLWIRNITTNVMGEVGSMFGSIWTRVSKISNMGWRGILDNLFSAKVLIPIGIALAFLFRHKIFGWLKNLGNIKLGNIMKGVKRVGMTIWNIGKRLVGAAKAVFSWLGRNTDPNNKNGLGYWIIHVIPKIVGYVATFLGYLWKLVPKNSGTPFILGMALGGYPWPLYGAMIYAALKAVGQKVTYYLKRFLRTVVGVIFWWMPEWIFNKVLKVLHLDDIAGMFTDTKHSTEITLDQALTKKKDVEDTIMKMSANLSLKNNVNPLMKEVGIPDFAAFNKKVYDRAAKEQENLDAYEKFFNKSQILFNDINTMAPEYFGSRSVSEALLSVFFFRDPLSGAVMSTVPKDEIMKVVLHMDYNLRVGAQQNKLRDAVDAVLGYFSYMNGIRSQVLGKIMDDYNAKVEKIANSVGAAQREAVFDLARGVKEQFIANRAIRHNMLMIGSDLRHGGTDWNKGVTDNEIMMNLLGQHKATENSKELMSAEFSQAGHEFDEAEREFTKRAADKNDPNAWMKQGDLLEQHKLDVEAWDSIQKKDKAERLRGMKITDEYAEAMSRYTFKGTELRHDPNVEEKAKDIKREKRRRAGYEKAKAWNQYLQERADLVKSGKTHEELEKLGYNLKYSEWEKQYDEKKSKEEGGHKPKKQSKKTSNLPKLQTEGLDKPKIVLPAIHYRLPRKQTKVELPGLTRKITEGTRPHELYKMTLSTGSQLVRTEAQEKMSAWTKYLNERAALFRAGKTNEEVDALGYNLKYTEWEKKYNAEKTAAEEAQKKAEKVPDVEPEKKEDVKEEKPIPKPKLDGDLTQLIDRFNALRSDVRNAFTGLTALNSVKGIKFIIPPKDNPLTMPKRKGKSKFKEMISSIRKRLQDTTNKATALPVNDKAKELKNEKLVSEMMEAPPTEESMTPNVTDEERDRLYRNSGVSLVSDTQWISIREAHALEERIIRNAKGVSDIIKGLALMGDNLENAKKDLKFKLYDLEHNPQGSVVQLPPKVIPGGVQFVVPDQAPSYDPLPPL